MRPAFRHFLRYGVSIGLISFLLLQIDLSKVFASVTHLSVELLAGVLLIAIAQVYITSIRWYLMLRTMAIRLPFGMTVEANVMSIFANVFLVNVIGGAVTRAALLSSYDVPVHKTLATVILERIIIVGVLVVMTIGGLTWVDLPVQASHNVSLFGVLGSILLLVLAAMIADRSKRVNAKARKLVAYIVCIFHDMQCLIKDRKAMIVGLILTTISQLLLVGIGIFGAQSLDIAISWIDLLALLPSVTLLSSLPVSIGGIGVREVSLVYALGLFNVPAEQALVLSLMIVGVSVLGAVIAGLIAFAMRHLGTAVR